MSITVGISSPEHALAIKSTNLIQPESMVALHFSENGSGNYSASLRSTDLVAGANHAVVIDAFGNGLTDLVFTYGCHNPTCAIQTPSRGEMRGQVKNKVYFNRNYGAAQGRNASDYQPHDMLVSVSNGAGIRSASAAMTVRHRATLRCCVRTRSEPPLTLPSLTACEK